MDIHGVSKYPQRVHSVKLILNVCNNYSYYQRNNAGKTSLDLKNNLCLVGKVRETHAYVVGKWLFIINPGHTISEYKWHEPISQYWMKSEENICGTALKTDIISPVLQSNCPCVMNPCNVVPLNL